jgi:hypothetical protein
MQIGIALRTWPRVRRRAGTAMGVLTVASLGLLTSACATPQPEQSPPLSAQGQPVAFDFWSLVDQNANLIEVLPEKACSSQLAPRVTVNGANETLTLLTTSAAAGSCAPGPGNLLKVALPRSIGCTYRLIDGATRKPPPAAPGSPAPPAFSCPQAPVTPAPTLS